MEDKPKAPETPLSGLLFGMIRFGDAKAWAGAPSRKDLPRREQVVLAVVTYNPLLTIPLLHVFTTWPRAALFGVLIWLALAVVVLAVAGLINYQRAKRGTV